MVAFPGDLAFARRLAARDPSAWEEAAGRYGPLIRSVVRRTWASVPSEALDDAAEEVFLALLAREGAALRAYEGRAPLGAYLSVVSQRVALRLLEEEARHALNPAEIAALARHLDARQGTDPPDEEALDVLRSALDQLPSRQRRVMRGLVLEGLSPEALASEMGIRSGVVATLAWRARKRLGEAFRKSGKGPR